MAYPEARTAASHALELDDSSAEALAVLGFVNWFLEWDLARAEQDLRRAIEINASSEFAHVAYAKFLLVARGQREAACEQMRLALELDPLSLNTNFSFAWFLVFAHEPEQAVVQARKTLNMFPDAVQACYALGCAELFRSNAQGAVAAFEKAAARTRDNTSLSYLAHALGRDAQNAAARSILGELRALRERAFVPEFSLAVAHAGLGDADAVFEALERCLIERDCHLFWLDFIPFFETVRHDPRFADLQARVRLATEAHRAAFLRMTPTLLSVRTRTPGRSENDPNVTSGRR
jgi:Tfp pilus assembly protein PilF